MESNTLCVTQNDLLGYINFTYGIRGEIIRLHREMSGRVYFIHCPGGRKVLKLYRPAHTECAIQTTRIIPWLGEQGFPVVRIAPTAEGELYTLVPTHEGRRVGILFEYAPGQNIGFLHRWREPRKQPPIHPKARLIGSEVARMHLLMENYPESLISKRRDRYIDDLIMLMSRDGCLEAQIRDLGDYGTELWRTIKDTRPGFCHGDMHTGNTRYHGGTFTWMDFDRASLSYPIVDVGWLADGTDFNVFDSGALERSLRLFDEVYAGYGAVRPLSDKEIKAVFASVAIVHYDLISSIVIMNHDTLRKEFMDEQHGWLMRWREMCMKPL